jgi:hypothetical protein
MITVLLAWSLFASSHSAPPMEARIVAPDGTPIAGAIVVASWSMRAAGSNFPVGPLAVGEAVTDVDGRFRIPGWGPRQARDGSINIAEPQVRVFKPGFVPLVLDNFAGVPMWSASSVIVFRFQNQNLTMAPFAGGLAEYEQVLDPLLNSLNVIFRTPVRDGCLWRETPRLLLSLEDLKFKLAENNGGYTIPLARNRARQRGSPECGDPQQFFQEKREALRLRTAPAGQDADDLKK